MGRGFLTGVFWGCAIGVTGLVAASLLARPPVEDAPVAAQAAVPPLQRFARPFDDHAGGPLFAVVLIDRGGDRAALAALPFPVTFAVDPAAPDAVDAARIYRRAGQEVVVLATGMAGALSPETVLQGYEATLPEAVAVMDLERQGFQGAAELADRTVHTLGAQGRGLITWNNGPNTADTIARREGLPSVRVFRKLDARAETAEGVRAALERAAFRATQDGQVVVVGDARAPTVLGLTRWAEQADGIAMAPASAVMMRPR